MSIMDRLSSKVGRTAEQKKKKESSELGARESYLDYLRSHLSPSADESTLDEKIKDDLGIDLSTYSKGARTGFHQFLAQMKGFQGVPLEKLAVQSPLYMGAMDGVPEPERGRLNFIQGYLYNPRIRDAFVRASALLADHPDAMSEMFTGRLCANYYGDLIGRKIGDEAIELIAELADSQEAVEKELEKISSLPSGETDKRAPDVVLRLRKEADKVSSEVFGKELRRALEYDPEGYEGFSDSIVRPLENIVASRRVFLASFKHLRENGELKDIDKLADVSLECKSSSDIAMNGELTTSIEALYKKCHAADKPEYLKEIIERNKDKIDGGQSHFYIFSYKNQLIGMTRFDPKWDKEGHLTGLYAGGLNVDPDFGGGRIGDTIIDETFANERRHGVPIDAHVRTDSPLALRYLSGEFVADAIEPLAGMYRFHIVLDPSLLDRLATKHKNVSADDIVRHAERGDRTNQRIFAVYNSLPEEIPEGFVLSRLVPRNGKYYAAFERPPTSEERLAEAA